MWARPRGRPEKTMWAYTYRDHAVSAGVGRKALRESSRETFTVLSSHKCDSVQALTELLDFPPAAKRDVEGTRSDAGENINSGGDAGKETEVCELLNKRVTHQTPACRVFLAPQASDTTFSGDEGGPTTCRLCFRSRALKKNTPTQCCAPSTGPTPAETRPTCHHPAAASLQARPDNCRSASSRKRKPEEDTAHTDMQPRPSRLQPAPPRHPIPPARSLLGAVPPYHALGCRQLVQGEERLRTLLLPHPSAQVY
ncbi:hypothetical protein NDU88_003944 [Pleurodeles waltl]|uniref:Uncharacterized protein n=1 Tax=Pleurodeles waltl TaxID=8319 RepID=A0AAV7T6P8_PLEWA|nr:hypothetical protein NDU88_003944 [Pleurodeles waltl]